MEENLLFEATEKEYKMYKGMKYIFKEKKKPAVWLFTKMYDGHVNKVETSIKLYRKNVIIVDDDSSK